MYRIWIPAAAVAALTLSPALATAQTATDASTSVQQRDASATLSEHVERAGTLVDALLDWQPVQTNLDKSPSTAIAVSRDRVQSLKREVDGMKQALTARSESGADSSRAIAVGTLPAHVNRAKQLTAQLITPAGATAVGTSGAMKTGSQSTAQAGTAESHPPQAAADDTTKKDQSPIVTIDRTKLEQLNAEIEAIEHLVNQQK